MRYIFLGDAAPYIAALQTTRKARFERLRTQCDSYFACALPREHPPKSTTYMGIAIVNLALMFRMSGEVGYLREAERWMDAVAGYEKWGNAKLVNVDLSASWILFGLSLGYDWLKAELPDEKRARYAACIREHADIMRAYQLANRKGGWPVYYWQNHNWINFTGMAAAGYALCDDTLTRESRENFDTVFSLLAQDGSNYEGVSYWRYGGMWLFVYAWLLREREGVDWFEKSEHLQNTFLYRLYQSAPDLKTQMNFGDCHDKYSSHAACVYYLVAGVYKNGVAQMLGNRVTSQWLRQEADNSKVKPGILPEACFEFIWYDPTVPEQTPDGLPTERVFPDLGLASMRTSWRADATACAFKCGAPGGRTQWEAGWRMREQTGACHLSLSHHHPDNLSFMLIRGARYFTAEDGYNRNILPTHHCVPLVDGRQCDVMDVTDVYMDSVRKRLLSDPLAYKRFTGTMEASRVGGVTVLDGESAGTYAQELAMQSVRRIFITDNLRWIVLVDSFRSALPHTYQTALNTERILEERGGWQYDAAAGVRYRAFSDDALRKERFSQHISSVMTTQEPDVRCENDLETLLISTEGRHTEHHRVECLLFDEHPVSLDFTDGVLTLRDEHTLLRVSRLGLRVENEAVGTAGEAREWIL